LSLQQQQVSDITFGKYVLDSLSIGMYSDPIMALREYIQNSVDSIDLLPPGHGSPVIEITVDGRNRSLEIADNGLGISSNKVKSTLLSIGASDKDPAYSRGFRGIGRLGGLGYCDKLVFYTKSKGEKTYSVCSWNAKLLRQLINDTKPIDTNLLINKTAKIERHSYCGSAQDHFFKVQMFDINDSRKDLLNVPAIRSYLSQVAPVPFHSEFSFGEQINIELLKRVPSYRTYKIFLNKEQIFKQYRDTVFLCRESCDKIRGIQFVELLDNFNPLAFGWLGNLDFLGAINPGSGIDSIRLRCGNILLGNKDTLSSLFKETRFNHYLVGELHIVDNRLIPNSRRDDFEDSDIKGILFNEFLKKIGIPYSKKIRDLSKERGKAKQHDNVGILFEHAERVIRHGYLSSRQRDRIVDHLSNINGSHSEREVRLAMQLSEKIATAQDILSAQNISRRTKAEIISLLITTLDAIYEEMPSSVAFNKLVSKLYQELISHK